MSRNPSRSTKTQPKVLEQATQGNPVDDAIIAQVHAICGTQAATAVAVCGLDAWFDGEEAEFRRLAGLFRRLRN